MTLRFETPDIPDDPADMHDAFCVDALKQLRDDRRTKNVAFPRFVAALRSAGYIISVEEYKRCESDPLSGAIHVREGLLRVAYNVLNSSRVVGSSQSAETEFAVLRLTREREDREISHFDMANLLSSAGVPTSGAAWRTIEQGITTHVPWDTMITAAKILNVPLQELIKA